MALSEVKVERLNDVIYTIYPEEITPLIAKKILIENDHLIEILAKEGKPILLLTDASNMKRVSLEARKEAIVWAKREHYKKIGIFAKKNIYAKYLINMVLKVLNKSNTIRFFEDKKSAIKWLKSA